MSAHDDTDGTSAVAHSVYTIMSATDVPLALAQWQAEWSRINARRRARQGRPQLVFPTPVTADPAQHATRAAMRQVATTPTDDSSEASSAPSPQSSPLRGGLLASLGSAPSSPASVPNSSPARPMSKHGSRMHAAAMAAAAAASRPSSASGTSAASSPNSSPSLKRKSSALEETPTGSKPDLFALKHGAAISVHNGISMVALKPTASSASFGSDGVPSACHTPISTLRDVFAPDSKKPKLSSRFGPGSLIPPPCASPPPVPLSVRRSPSKTRPDALFSVAARRKSVKVAGAHTPGIHNSQGIFSFTVGADTPEDRDKRDLMVREYRAWREKQAARGTADAKAKATGQTHADASATPMAASTASALAAAVAGISTPAPAATAATASPPAVSTPQGMGVTAGTAAYSAPAGPAKVRRSLHTPSKVLRASMRPHPPPQAQQYARQAGEHVRRSLFDELSRSTAPRVHQSPLSASPAPAAARGGFAAAMVARQAAATAAVDVAVPPANAATTPAAPSTAHPAAPAPALAPPAVAPAPALPMPKRPGMGGSLFSSFASRKIVQAPAPGSMTAAAPFAPKTLFTLRTTTTATNNTASATKPSTPNIKSFFMPPAASPIASGSTAAAERVQLQEDQDSDMDSGSECESQLVIV